MDHVYHGRPPPPRRVLGDASSRANEDTRAQRCRSEKKSWETITDTSSTRLPLNESIVPNGSLAVRHAPQPSPENKRLSAVINEEGRPRNRKRDSEISNASTNVSTTSRRRKVFIGPWELGKTIGHGGCSRVRVVRHSVTKKSGAAKIISKAVAERVRAMSLANLIESAEHDPTLAQVIPFGLEREICIMKLLDHPNIVRLYDIWENRSELYLIMEYVEGGDLFNYINTVGPIQEIEVVYIFRQIIAALQYCHRLNIHHRDLKPENILVDRKSLTIKLVDFGMAALQPQGKKLTTPCGSPHYAAPEILRTTSYDGGQADVWSCGVILFVLLTGTPPFNYTGDNQDLQTLFRAITRAEYVMPDTLSKEAQDVIRRILVPDPKRRIPIDVIWKHPFLHKYNVQLGLEGERATMQYWVGPTPSIDQWARLERNTIDREILRYLRTLWHSEKEEVLIQRLLSSDGNQEKYFYSALLRYRHEYLEDYSPGAYAVEYSNSDHHHNAPTSSTQRDLSRLPAAKHSRSQSGYSILNNEHLYSKHSFYEPPPSDTSYDPFRSSRDPIIPDLPLNQNVTIYRGSGNGSQRTRPATALGHRTGSSLRVQAMMNSNLQSSVGSRNSSKRSTPSSRSQRSLAMKGRLISRSSMLSSQWPSSPPIVVRPSSIGKRGVSFSHLRRNSMTSLNTAETTALQYTPEQRRFLSNRSRNSATSSSVSPRLVVPSPLAAPRLVAKKPASPAVPRLRLRKPDSPSKYIQSEARKVSTELEKVMEEAFNRSSMSSSIRTATTDPHKDTSGFDTPPTSLSNRDSGGSVLATPNAKAVFQNRPLPPLPHETPNTFLERTLAETRAEIIRQRDRDGGDGDHFNDVLRRLDNLIQPASNGNKRATSAPTKPFEYLTQLPAISEEVRTDSADRYDPYSNTYRAVTDPIRPTLQVRRAVTEHSNTVRLVDASPPPVAPLNIRKRSGASTASKSANGDTAVISPGQVPNPPARSCKGVHGEPHQILRANDIGVSDVAPASAPEKKEGVVKKKKSLWFRRNPEEKERQTESQSKPSNTGRFQIPEAWQGLDDRMDKGPPSPKKKDIPKHTTKQSDGSASSEFPMRTSQNEIKERKGFLGLFGRKSKDDKNKRPLEFESFNFSSSSILSNFDVEDETSSSVVRAPEPQMNWLSRFLHIKPASKVVCFQIGRGRVRHDLVRLLRDWQRFGVRDVTLDRETNLINMRIDKSNHLKIKPVTLVIELFVMLEHGRRAKLCLARFTQTRGAASSFRKIVDIIEDVCRARGMLVQDEVKRAAMCEVLG